MINIAENKIGKNMRKI